jgi:hypothetical protein
LHRRSISPGVYLDAIGQTDAGELGESLKKFPLAT